MSGFKSTDKYFELASDDRPVRKYDFSRISNSYDTYDIKKDLNKKQISFGQPNNPPDYVFANTFAVNKRNTTREDYLLFLRYTSVPHYTVLHLGPGIVHLLRFTGDVTLDPKYGRDYVVVDERKPGAPKYIVIYYNYKLYVNNNGLWVTKDHRATHNVYVPNTRF